MPTGHYLRTQDSREQFFCHWCGKEIVTWRSAVKNHQTICCSWRCRRLFAKKNGRSADHLHILEEVLLPLGFVREYAIPYIKGHPYRIDFAHPENKIAIESDGSSHKVKARREKDKKKDELLKSLGWRVIHVCHYR